MMSKSSLNALTTESRLEVDLTIKGHRRQAC